MPSPPQDRVTALLHEAMKRAPALRLAFLRDACGEDLSLYARATALLASESPTVADVPLAHRWIVKRQLGAGTFGVVYEVEDTLRGTRLALKTLQRIDPESLYRFKREFRSLADVNHRNLVQLYELSCHDEQWFFTMELVDGLNFRDYVKAHAPLIAPPRSPASIERLLPSLRQLVEGLEALHRSGHLHRDVKPDNVLVDHDGRVVLLDFGLVMELSAEATHRSLLIAGTPTYMSPEQGAGLALTSASDLYSVGVMLYEVLTGVLPFTGTQLEILTAKQRLDPELPSAHVEGVPAELEGLCMKLLSRAPDERPSTEAVLSLMAGLTQVGSSVAPLPDRPRRPPFIGRQRHLQRLREAFDRVRSGGPAVVRVFGPSGIGKSLLVKTFLDELERLEPGTVVLRGRCYERESVPYKALDSLIDSLARHLKRLPPHMAEALVPRDMASVVQVFPMLREFESRSRNRLVQPRDAQELRRRAYSGLRELLARVGDRHPLVMFIDDLQWGDIDSAALLTDVIRPPDAPSLLLIAAYRDIEVETSPFLRAWMHSGIPELLDSMQVRVDPLEVDEARQLAASLLDRTPHDGLDIVRVIAAESGGSPFFIDELVRFAESLDVDGAEPDLPRRISDTDAREATLGHMIGIRISRLPSEAQHLLETVAVNGRPLAEDVVVAAASLSHVEASVSLLRAEHLLRGRETERGTEFEPYHDRIRELVVNSMSEQKRVHCHRSLAIALEASGAADPELLAEHWRGAGNSMRAADYMWQAGVQAEAALAFDRASRLYRQALHLLPHESGRRVATMIALARSLAYAGRCAEAAKIYLAAPVTTPDQSLELKQRAAELLLFSGKIDEGLTVIREVLDAVGMTLPETRWQTLVALAVGRARVRLRRLEAPRSDGKDVTVDRLRAVDACWSVAAGLGIVDTMRGAVFQSRHLLLALDVREPARIHRALCMEMVFAAAQGARQLARVQRIRATVAELTERVGTPYARAMQALTVGVSHYLCGEWKFAVTHVSEAEHLLATECTGVTWELDSARFFGLWAQYQMGQLRPIAERFQDLVKDAQERGDLYASTTLTGLFAHLFYLARGDPAGASRETARGIRQWGQDGFQLPQLWDLWSSVDVAVYEGRGVDAYERVREGWAAAKRSLLLEVQFNRIYMLDLRARAALAAALDCQAPDLRDDRRREAMELADAMMRERVPWAQALGLLVRAGAEASRGNHEQALDLYRSASDRFVGLDMALCDAVARHRRGLVLGGSAGAELVDAAADWMRAEGVHDPSAFARMLAPR